LGPLVVAARADQARVGADASGSARAGGRSSVNVLVVSGIWPPDVGGPASHAPEVASFLDERGHHVAVVTTAERAPAREGYEVHWVSRRLPVGLRHLASVRLVRARAAHADIVYT